MSEELNGDALDEQDAIKHYGILRKSGRYPWGSGSNPMQRSTDFFGMVDKLRAKGHSDADIAKGFGLKSSTELRDIKTIALNAQQREKEAQAKRLIDTGMSVTAVGREMGINESSVRSLLNPSTSARRAELENTASVLREHLKDKPYVDVGVGIANHMGVSNDKLRTAVAMLEDDGYEVHYLKVKQLGTGQFTTHKVLAPAGTVKKDIYDNLDQIATPAQHSPDNGKTFLGLRPIENVSAKRLEVKYGPDGGADKDGVIELRRGVKDLDMGESRYAQVRIGVEGGKYLKGMAVYADDLPDGIDIRFNTNKTNTGNKLDALKDQKTDEKGKIDKDNPFGASIKPGGQRGALNIVNEEGDWQDWSRNLASQMLSKQSPVLAKQQLDLTYKIKKEQFDEINNLTNPVVKRKLLESFADDLDASATHLKAAALPRQATHVILPLTKIKEDQIYAPKYNDGEQVALVRYPHGGKFEIPVLTVNNKLPSAKAVMDRARDAVGIHPKVAEILSGADFDGDTVLVIPTNAKNKIQNKPPLDGLKDFDPKTQYRKYDGMKVMTPKQTQTEMGKVSNLITDMTLRGANDSEIERAVKHSMVVIDAEKHKLNWRQSEIDNGISELKARYQGGANKGASTLISRSTSEQRVDSRKPRPASQGGPIDPVTGRKVFVTKTEDSYVNAKGETVIRKISSNKMAEVDDARKLISTSNTIMENVYADHANRMKSMANEARKELLVTKDVPYSPSAKKTYSSEVASLNSKLNVALKNAPVERKAQAFANAVVNQRRQANPHMDADDIKKVSFQALAAARNRFGAGKTLVNITPNEWNAVQAGAISSSKLKSILNNADIEVVKQLATPRRATVMTPAKTAMVKAMLGRGYTQAEIAAHLGIPASTIDTALDR